jgi:hypothetical protein
MAICRFQYAAKVICGNVQEPGSVVPGIYRTEVNVHNPNQREVFLRKKLAVAIPPGQQLPGELHTIAEHGLKAGLALAVDCEHLWRILTPPPPPPPPTPFFVGFLIIESTESLDVTAVYTTAGIRGSAPGIAVEQIKERRIAFEERP